MNIEGLAVRAVQNSLDITDKLQGFINCGEKMPSWDGDLILYKYNNYKKEDAKKLPVQVKGLTNSDFSKQKINYSVKKDDLSNYLSDGGVVFFVVYITEDGRNSKIYYRSLLPVFIKDKLAKSSAESQSVSIEFYEFPDEQVEKMNICCDFVRDRISQFSFINYNLQSIEDFKNKGDFDFNFTFADSDGSMLTHPEKLCGKDAFIYAIDKKTNMKLPTTSIASVKSLAKEIPLPISVNGKKFYDSYFVISNENYNTTQIGRMFKISCPILEDRAKEEGFKLNITMAGSLRSRIQDLKFIVEMQKNKSFDIGNIHCPFILNDDQMKLFNDSKYPELLEFYENIQKILDDMNVCKELDLDNISESDLKNMNALIESINENKSVGIRSENLPLQGRMKISNISLTLLTVPDENDYTKYKYANAYDKNINICLFEDKNKDNQAPSVCLLKKDNFLYDDNIDYDFIVKRILEFDENPMLYYMSNQLLLEILLAYDINKNEKLYNAANKIATFLEEKELTEISKLNLYQVKKRKEALTLDEMRDIEKIKKDTSDGKVKVACSILLDSFALAQSELNELTDDKDYFMKLPIYNLIIKEKNNG